MIAPRISTRRYYDLLDGKTLKTNSYSLYPKNFFDTLESSKEIVVMIHGLRNDSASAAKKFEIARNRLRRIGYKHPVIGFSYDSNTRGAHLKKTELRALRVGQKIAQKNGKNLSRFIADLKKFCPQIKIRLIGHSLGSQVILSTIDFLSKNSSNKNLIETAHFFGASITFNDLKKNRKKINTVINKKIVNYFAPSDEVLQYAHDTNSVKNPLGLSGSMGGKIPKYAEKKVKPRNHRFASYALTIRNFP
ncbi:DUF726 domain-containing protein [Nitrosopumilus sp. b1]|uniref:lipase family alpha/beta hydrolase n=1 Tax=Nitrosopumilus sp. b1 TaxID=2109907 RepID=UPI0015F75F20|nr:DUF726 domain-containing protein [Nitrosopumilus sp. b1]KAF6243381.1 DUF726 domain-containing protein [Nitrosopumilus sp. b1]